jgi:hypothetical protein
MLVTLPIRDEDGNKTGADLLVVEARRVITDYRGRTWQSLVQFPKLSAGSDNVVEVNGVMVAGETIPVGILDIAKGNLQFNNSAFWVDRSASTHDH